MVIELKDSAGKVVHNKFHKWREQNPSGMFLSVESKTKANLHGVPCHHAGTYPWHPGASSLTKKMKVLEDGPGSLQQWAADHGMRIHVCHDCRSKGFIIGNFDVATSVATRNSPVPPSLPKAATAFLLAWNPERFEWIDLPEDIADIHKKGFVTRRWSCGNRKNLPKGSEIFLIRLGKEPKGIIGRGIATSKATESTHWAPEKRRQSIKGWNVDVRITELSELPIVPWHVLQTRPLSNFGWSIQASGVRLPEDMADALRAQWPAQTADGSDASDPDDGQLAEDLAAEAAIMNDPNLAQTVKEAIILARRGQGRFRKNVLHVESKCCLTGVTDPNHLIASHIKPWKASTNDERLCADNGLMLGPHIDHLFDKGYIGFTDVGDLLVSPKCAPAVLRAWGISRSTNVRPFRQAQRPFLKYHRQHVFQG